MTLNNTFDNLVNFVDLLGRSYIAAQVNAVIVKHIRNSGIRRVTWGTTANNNEALLSYGDSTIREYRHWLSANEYSVVLFDGSIVQITYDFLGNSLTKHRLLYFPCPFQLPSDLLGELTILDLVDNYIERGIDDVRLRAPVRFDYERETDAVDHPASHFTFQSPHCRIPVVSPLSLGHFVKFVFRNFYPQQWREHRFIRDWQTHEFERSIEADELKRLHLSYVS